MYKGKTSLNIITKVLTFILFINKIILEECPIDKPILVENKTCDSIYCSDSQFESYYCIINNNKIKTQWLNNIIDFGEFYFRYINFVTYTNGDMVIETTACPGNSGKRIFFGLKKNGRYFFNNKTEETPFYLFIAEIENESLGKKYESEIFI